MRDDDILTPPEREALRDAILGTASDAIIYADRGGLIRFWNPGAERMFGHTRAEAIGSSLDIIIPLPQRARHWEGFERVMAGGETRYGHGDILAVPGLRKDGSRISLEFTIVPLHDKSGDLQGIVAILRDVTARFEEMRALRRRLTHPTDTA
ncbi:MAG: hypothetical protein JWO26_3568 [Rhodospirillales bacterium]|jgi:PAS domain S-box-containing protein|nr:hypothetical protein [Rhodospirillales bacterium]MDB5383936.1 hypothetical protein [Rhodospirillales bacterium]